MGAEILKRDVLIYMKQDGPIVSSEVGTPALLHSRKDVVIYGICYIHGGTIDPVSSPVSSYLG